MKKRVIKINEELQIEIIKTKNETETYLIENGEKRVLSILETDEYFWCDVLYDENYIIVYSRGDMFTQIPLVIEVAYNIKTKKMVDLSNRELKKLLENRFLFKKYFDLKDVLSFINDVDLKLVSSKDGLIRLKEYLTSGNEQVDRQKIIEYILKEYPILEKYSSIENPPYVKDYLKLIEEIGESYFCFHSMPIDLGEETKMMVKSKDNN